MHPRGFNPASDPTAMVRDTGNGDMSVDRPRLLRGRMPVGTRRTAQSVLTAPRDVMPVFKTVEEFTEGGMLNLASIGIGFQMALRDIC